MTTLSRRSFALAGTAALLSVALPLRSLAQTQAVQNRAIFQVTDNDPARWNIVLNNMQNLREGVAPEPIEIELVAYGPGVAMLKADSSVRERIDAALKNGVRVNACENTMRNMKLAPADMLPAIGYVPSGVVEVMRKQQQGWAYIRP